MEITGKPVDILWDIMSDKVINKVQFDKIMTLFLEFYLVPTLNYSYEDLKQDLLNIVDEE